MPERSNRRHHRRDAIRQSSAARGSRGGRHAARRGQRDAGSGCGKHKSATTALSGTPHELSHRQARRWLGGLTRAGLEMSNNKLKSAALIRGGRATRRRLVAWREFEARNDGNRKQRRGHRGHHQLGVTMAVWRE